MQQPISARREARVSPLNPPIPHGAGESFCWSRLYGSARGLAIAQAAAQQQKPLLVIAADTRSVRQLEDEIRFYATPAPQISVITFPDWECLPYDVLSPHADIISQRLYALYRLQTMSPATVSS